MDQKQSAIIVDDDAGFISEAAGALRASGISRVLSTGDGQTELEIVTGSKEGEGVDFVVLNPTMPGYDCVDLLREFARSGFAGSIILTGSQSSEVCQSAWKIGQCLGLSISPVPRNPLAIGEGLLT